MGNFEIMRDELEEKVHLVIGKSSLLDCKVSYQKNTGLVEIGDRSYIATNTNLICVDKIHIGNDVLISWDCTIYDNDSHGVEFEYRKNDVVNMIESLSTTGKLNSNKEWKNVKSKPIIIEDKVWIGFGVTILKGVTIGEGAVIGAKSVVTADIPSYAVAAGNPARVIRLNNN
ncbi:acyltransferase [Clostridium felsineum]|nr:acyltransferase [Clostridium felsineum]